MMTPTMPLATAQGQFPAPLPAVLSYLIPGLGQVYQGRIGKGILFFVCIYCLFFYGMFLGSGVSVDPDTNASLRVFGKNVYLPDVTRGNGGSPLSLTALSKNLYNRPQFIGQFWVGMAAWPAIWQYLSYHEYEEMPRALGNGGQVLRGRGPVPDPLFGQYQQAPTERVINELQIHGDKTWDLGWVLTVIAGVLNVLVIYDAFAGPVFHLKDEPETGTST